MVAFFADTAAAGQAVSAIVAAGIVPGAIEMMDRLRPGGRADGARRVPPRRRSSAAGRARRARMECDARLEHVIALDRRPIEIGTARDDQERELMWKARKAAFAAMGRIAPAYFVQDGVIPRTRLPEVLREIETLAAQYGLQVANVFHAGDGNLHPLVCYDSARPGSPSGPRNWPG